MLDPRLTALYKKLEEYEKNEQWVDLVPIYKEAIRISLEVYGENHDETLALYTEYGGLLRNLGRYEEGLKYLKKALSISAATKGPTHPDYAAALINLANLLRMMGEHSESEMLFLRAKTIFEYNAQTTTFAFAGLCNNLGLLYQDMGRYGKAIPYHKISLSILENDKEHILLYGVTLNNLVEPYKHTGNRAMALEYLNRAIEIFKSHESASVLYAGAQNNLGAFYYEDKEYAKAAEAFQAAMKICEEKLGVQSQSYVRSKQNYEMAKKALAASMNASVSFVHFAMENSEDGARAASLSATSKGLAISEAYFYDVCYPMLKKEFAEYLPRMAAGLIGEGSECYGYDDMISRDHDFGPSFQLFIPREDAELYGYKLRDAVNNLPKEYAGFQGRNECTYGKGRVGVFSVEAFYEKYLSTHEVPTSNKIWMQMDDISLSTATNGKVFLDNFGRFTEIRKGLLNHYPKDVCLKKIAYYCTQAAQSGQYNFPRSIQRKQYVAAYHALDEFVKSYTSILYLLNKVYKPYYKWEHEGLKKLPVLGQIAHRDLNKLVQIPVAEKANYAVFVIEDLCKRLINVFTEREMTGCGSDFLLDHAPHIMSRIEDEALRNSNPWLNR